ncbi:hypothetical protein JKP88DRAFT_255112 [Tribonema minus]|uniref:Uncharacterized protein n=1 Tax=Tribonema minus TaxID=303371 RepID=A0A835Z146_9STRA|nr:hypothetical protein JKP88DRAFT_255112 [Tribonema minus]
MDIAMHFERHDQTLQEDSPPLVSRNDRRHDESRPANHEWQHLQQHHDGPPGLATPFRREFTRASAASTPGLLSPDASPLGLSNHLPIPPSSLFKKGPGSGGLAPTAASGSTQLLLARGGYAAAAAVEPSLHLHVSSAPATPDDALQILHRELETRRGERGGGVRRSGGGGGGGGGGGAGGAQLSETPLAEQQRSEPLTARSVLRELNRSLRALTAVAATLRCRRDLSARSLPVGHRDSDRLWRQPLCCTRLCNRRTRGRTQPAAAARWLVLAASKHRIVVADVASRSWLRAERCRRARGVACRCAGARRRRRHRAAQTRRRRRGCTAAATQRHHRRRRSRALLLLRRCNALLLLREPEAPAACACAAAAAAALLPCAAALSIIDTLTRSTAAAAAPSERRAYGDVVSPRVLAAAACAYEAFKTAAVLTALVLMACLLWAGRAQPLLW